MHPIYNLTILIIFSVIPNNKHLFNLLPFLFPLPFLLPLPPLSHSKQMYKWSK